jgi:hypothetical protein
MEALAFACARLAVFLLAGSCRSNRNGRSDASLTVRRLHGPNVPIRPAMTSDGWLSVISMSLVSAALRSLVD